MSVNKMRYSDYRNLYITEYDFFDNIIWRLNQREYPHSRQIQDKYIFEYIAETIIAMTISYAKLYMKIDMSRDFIGYTWVPTNSHNEAVITFHIVDTYLSPKEKELYSSVFDTVSENSWRPKVGPNIFTIIYNKEMKGDEINVNRGSRSKPPKYSRPYY